VHRIRLAGLAVSVTAAALTLTGCSVITAFTPHVESAIYADAKEFTPSATSAFGSPTFLPDDATLIRVDWDTEGKGAIMMYTSKAHFKPEMCKEVGKVPKTEIQDSWWPSPVPAEGSVCPGGWTAFGIGDKIYAVTTTSPAS
jgi:hypothetical protein